MTDFQAASAPASFTLGDPCPACGVIRRADSTIDTIGGHPLHTEGGSDLMWRLTGHLTMLHRELSEQIAELSAETERVRALGVDVEPRPHPSDTRYLIGV